MIDLDMTNNELMEKAKVSKSTFYKMKNGQNVTTDFLLRIYNALDCDIEEIVECIKDNKKRRMKNAFKKDESEKL